MKKPDFDVERKVMEVKDARQRNTVEALKMSEIEQKDILEGLDTLFRIIVVVVDGCIAPIRQPMLLRFVMGRLDDLLTLERRPGGSITASVEEIQTLCEICVKRQTDEIRREHLTDKDISDLTTIVQVIMSHVLTMSRTLPFRETVLMLAREQIVDLMTFLGSNPALSGSRISNLPFVEN